MKFDKKEFYRDVESLGSFTFYAIVIIRSLVGFYWIFFFQLFFSLLLSRLLLRGAGYFLKQKISSHASNAVIVGFFVNLFYKSQLFLFFSAFILIFLLIGHKKIRKHSLKEIISGLVVGAVSAGMIWWFV